MVEILQALGTAYLALMLYLTFLYYKRNNYSARSFAFWIVVWSVGILMLIVPQTTSLITQKLQVTRVIDFYLIVGLMFFSIICFWSFVKAKKTEARVEELVRQIALQTPKKKGRKR